MKELSLNVLDIAENSAAAGASLIRIQIDETAETMTITVADNGNGMKPDFLDKVTNPFTTTKVTRTVGLGIPLFQMAAAQTGGSFHITSTHLSADSVHHGTTVTAIFQKKHIDFTPLGDIVLTVKTLIQGHPETDFLFVHRFEKKTVTLDTRQIRRVLGQTVPLNAFEVIQWIGQYLTEQYDNSSK